MSASKTAVIYVAICLYAEHVIMCSSSLSMYQKIIMICLCYLNVFLGLTATWIPIMLQYLWANIFRRYVFCCSYSHNVAPKGKYIAFVTSEAETDNPQVELKPGVDLLGPVDEIFYDNYDRFEPTNQHDDDNCFISTVSVILRNFNFCIFFYYLLMLRVYIIDSQFFFLFMLIKHWLITFRVMMQQRISKLQWMMWWACTAR